MILSSWESHPLTRGTGRSWMRAAAVELARDARAEESRLPHWEDTQAAPWRCPVATSRQGVEASSQQPLGEPLRKRIHQSQSNCQMTGDCSSWWLKSQERPWARGIHQSPSWIPYLQRPHEIITICVALFSFSFLAAPMFLDQGTNLSHGCDLHHRGQSQCQILNPRHWATTETSWIKPSPPQRQAGSLTCLSHSRNSFSVCFAFQGLVFKQLNFNLSPNRREGIQ